MRHGRSVLRRRVAEKSNGPYHLSFSLFLGAALRQLSELIGLRIPGPRRPRTRKMADASFSRQLWVLLTREQGPKNMCMQRARCRRINHSSLKRKKKKNTTIVTGFHRNYSSKRKLHAAAIKLRKLVLGDF